MKISRQLLLMAVINGAALLCAIALCAFRLAGLRASFADYERDQSVLYQLAEIKATTLAISRADLLAPETTQQLAAADTLVQARWAGLRDTLPATAREASTKLVTGNWSEYRKSFDNALKIFTTAPQDALSIPDRIYGLYLVPLDQEVDRLIALRQQTAIAHRADISQRIDNLLWIILTPLLIAGGLVLAYQLRFGQRIRRRVAEMNRVSALLAHGDLTQRLPEAPADEFGELARSLNGFIHAFESMLADVKSAADAVRSNAHAIRDKASVVESHTGAQSGALREVSRSIDEISDATDEIATSVSQAAESSSAASALTTEASRIGRQTSDKLGKLQQAVSEATARIEHLTHAIEQIGNVSALIRDIANQTNLLALNAAIEAARAGEHGRGFAVVADEVRGLSERTASSTARIEELLQTVRAASAEVVGTIRVAEAEAGEGREQGEWIARTLAEIEAAIGNVSRMLDAIAASTEQHSASTGNIGGHVENVVGVAQETVAQMERTGFDILALVGVADRMRQATGRFQVSAG